MTDRPDAALLVVGVLCGLFEFFNLASQFLNQDPYNNKTTS